MYCSQLNIFARFVLLGLTNNVGPITSFNSDFLKLIVLFKGPRDHLRHVILLNYAPYKNKVF